MTPSARKSRPRRQAPSLVIGVGASAGGLGPLQSFFQAVSPDSGLAYVVITHLDPSRESQLAELLQQRTSVPVTQVTASVKLEADHVYVIPPDRDLRLEDGTLRLSKRGERAQHAPIDLFFKTLAAACGPTAVGVVLSGTGADGTAGLGRIREGGGITVAQAPDEAEYDSMPRSAISAGHADLVLPAADIPGELVRLCQTERRLRVSDDPDAAGAAGEHALDDDENKVLRQIFGRVRAATGHDFSAYKRSTVLRRLERRLRVRRTQTLAQYRDLLRGDPDEIGALHRDLLISVTSFFRDPEAFEALRREVVPRLFEGSPPHGRIRVWVPACATGEEVYSLAMLFFEHAALLEDPPALQFFATDVDGDACAVARAGHYPPTIAADVDPERLRRFFVREAAGYRVVDELRETVLVAKHDFLRDPPFSRLDLISCRHVLIYLQPEAQTRALQLFHYALRPGGFLFLGGAESAEGGKLFDPVDRKRRIYRRSPHVATPRSIFSRPQDDSPRAADEPGATGPPSFSYGALHLRMLEAYAAPSLVVNEDHELVHLSGRAGEYLRIGGGAPSRNVIDLAPGELKGELRTALYQAFRTGRPTRHGVRIETPEGGQPFELVVRPLELDEGGGRFALILFEEGAKTEAQRDATRPAPAEGGDFAAVEEELRRTRAQLGEAVQERDMIVDALQTANEELQSINEEQRAAGEELETSREELQSLNEELLSVNQELRTTNESLVQINADLRNLIAATGIATIFLDRELRVRRFTPSATQIFNLVDLDRGRPLSDLTHRLRYAGLMEDARHVMASLEKVEREVEGEGGTWYAVRVLPYRSVQDRIDGVVLSFFDITSLKRVQSNLEEANRRIEAERARLAALMDQMQAAVLIVDAASGRILSANRRFQEIWQADASFVESSDIYALAERAFRRDGTPYTSEDWPVARAIRDGSIVHDEEIACTLADGRTVTLLVSVAPVKAREGDVESAVVTLDPAGRRVATGRVTGAIDAAVVSITDISERARREIELREAKAQAERANVAKATFLSSVSHELRSPLTAILIYAEMLQEIGAFNGLEQQMLNRIQLSTHHVDSLIDQLLAFARLEEGQESVKLVTVDARAIAREAAVIGEPGATAKGIGFHLNLPDLAVELETDRDKARQILVNLLGNAVKYTDQGEIRLGVRVEGEHVVFDVCDTGVGIAAEDREKVFERFWRVTPERTRSGGGMGLGLAVVRGLTRLLGGEVKLESEVGRGSTFSVWLPRRFAGR